MALTPADLVGAVGGLAMLLDVYSRINRLVDDADSTTTDIAEAIGQDPSFTVRLLRVANSVLYAFPSTVDSAAKAVVIIGTSQIRSLTLSMSVASCFDGLPNELVSMENFWRHSLRCALAARHLAKEARCRDPDALFTAGLLHDIGQLVIFNRLPEPAREVLLLVLDSQDEVPVHEAERQILGFNHADVGSELARRWKLPALLEECIAFHHRIEPAAAYPRETALLHIANILALMAELDTLDPADVEPIDPVAWGLAALDPRHTEATVRRIQSEIADAEQLFIGSR